jgi:murein DD-endopeptidase MepM/ murein hydrolase activator NlpD
LRKLLFLVFFSLSLYALDITKGEVDILELNPGDTLSLDDKTVPVLQNPIAKNKRYAIIAIDYKNKLKDRYLLLNGKKIPLHVRAGKYKKEQIKVAKSKVKPSKTALNEIYKEYKEAKKIYATNTPKRYWNKPFILPLHSKITSSYGNARMFNGVLKSFHSGTDFRAKIGTKIKAANDGVVVIAKKRYYAGGSVVIDHGNGIYSCYYHLSKILVKDGEKVKQNEIIGLSGQSGRVNGPHLHFGIRVYSHALNPLQFVNSINQLFKGKI